MRDPYGQLSRRERQIMEVLYRLGRATVQEVLANMEDPPSYSAVRAHLRILEEKKHIRHREEGPRYVFFPVVSRERARRSALQRLLHNFFGGSHEQLVQTLLEDPDADLSEAELDALRRMIEQARREGR